MTEQELLDRIMKVPGIHKASIRHQSNIGTLLTFQTVYGSWGTYLLERFDSLDELLEKVTGLMAQVVARETVKVESIREAARERHGL